MVQVDEEGEERKPCFANDSRPEDEMKPPVGRAESERVKRRCSSAELGSGEGNAEDESDDMDIDRDIHRRRRRCREWVFSTYDLRGSCRELIRHSRSKFTHIGPARFLRHG